MMLMDLLIFYIGLIEYFHFYGPNWCMEAVVSQPYHTFTTFTNEYNYCAIVCSQKVFYPTFHNYTIHSYPGFTEASCSLGGQAKKTCFIIVTVNPFCSGKVYVIRTLADYCAISARFQLFQNKCNLQKHS